MADLYQRAFYVLGREEQDQGQPNSRLFQKLAELKFISKADLSFHSKAMKDKVRDSQRMDGKKVYFEL